MICLQRKLGDCARTILVFTKPRAQVVAEDSRKVGSSLALQIQAHAFETYCRNHA